MSFNTTETDVGISMIKRLPDNQGMRFLLTPNRSISWPALVRVWLGLAGVTLLVVTGATLMGAWLVIPFAGLELAALAAGLWYTARQCYRRQVLTFGQTNLRLEKGHECRENEWELPRQGLRILVDPKPHPFAPERLWLCHRGQEIPLAEFLNPVDARKLRVVLESQGLRVERRSRQKVEVRF